MKKHKHAFIRNALVWLGLHISNLGNWIFCLGWEGSQAELECAEDIPEEYHSDRQQVIPQLPRSGMGLNVTFMKYLIVKLGDSSLTPARWKNPPSMRYLNLSHFKGQPMEPIYRFKGPRSKPHGSDVLLLNLSGAERNLRNAIRLLRDTADHEEACTLLGQIQNLKRKHTNENIEKEQRT
jgi:hypothetical protein